MSEERIFCDLGLKLSGSFDDDLGAGFAALTADFFDGFHDIHAVGDLSKK